MNTYFRLLSYGKPWGATLPQYIIYSLLYVIFSVFNLALLIPLLDVLFNQVNVEAMEIPAALPAFSLEISYFKELFNYYFQTTIINEGVVGALIYVCLIIVGASFLSNLFRYLIMVILAVVRSRLIRNLRAALYENLTRLHLGYFTEKRKGDIVSRATNDIQQIEWTVVDSIKVFMQEPVLLLGQFILLFSISVKLTFYTLILLPISATLIGVISKSLKQKASLGQETMGRITNTVEETLTGVRLIKAFTARSAMIDRFWKHIDGYARIMVSVSKRTDLASPFSEFMGIAIVTGILLIGGIAVLDNDSDLTASQFITFIIVFARILQPAKAIAASYSTIQRGLAAGDRVFEIIDAKSEIVDAPDAVEAPAITQSISLKNVHFAYEDDAVLKGINIEIPKGKTIALVGPSGAGKSTIADLIPRFYDPTDGAVLLDGVDIRKYTLDSYRNQMGIVTQESIMFNDTIFRNIAFGMDATEEEVIAAARIANAHDFILETPEGYQTVIGEQGSKLSGGQRQRLSIARAIMRNPAILILDEATSALDSESEKLVQDALTKLMSNRTSVVIAHRLSTIQHADEILVLDKGSVVERGKHDELIANGGIYSKLTDIQKA